MSRQIHLLGQSHNIEVNIQNNNQRVIQFTDSVIGMDNVLVNGIYIPTNILKTPSFASLLNINRISGGLITLAGYNNEMYNTRLPIRIMQKDLGAGFYNFNVLFLQPKLISIRNSFIEFPDINNWNVADTPASICITFLYEKYDPKVHQLNSWGELIKPHKKSLPPAAPVTQTKPPAGAIKFRSKKPNQF
jgi:hypothetical protein